MPTFSLLTLNCFGVPTPTTRRRLRTLARELDRRESSVVCLQEVQSHVYRKLLLQGCASYAASAYAPFLHAPKGGLLTLARLPLVDAGFTLYRSREIPNPLALMDWMLHKGVLSTRFMQAGLPLIVLNTHLNANYGGDWRPSNRYTHNEREQLRQLAEIVAAQPDNALVIVAGDFNIPRGSWLYDEFLAESGLIDPLAADTRATYRLPRGVPAHYALPIDFALVRAPQLPGLQIASDLHFGEKMPFIVGKPGYLSDHLAIELHISWDATGFSSV